MIWVMKVTEAAGQYRITLPKAFCKEYKINEIEYLVMDDKDPDNITIGRLMHGSKEKRPGENG